MEKQMDLSNLMFWTSLAHLATLDLEKSSAIELLLNGTCPATMVDHRLLGI